MKQYNVRKSYSLLSLSVFLIIMGIASQQAVAQIKGCDSPCNLIKNGDFSMGNTGFTSGLNFQCGACGPGNYCVGAQFSNECNLWTLASGTSGNFMSIDGSNSADNVDVWKKTVKTCKGVSYTFSFQAKNVLAGADAAVNIGMMINGSNVQTAVVSSNTTWTTYTCTFIGTGAPANLALRQLTRGHKRDFGIDNIFFGFCKCECTPD